MNPSFGLTTILVDLLSSRRNLVAQTRTAERAQPAHSAMPALANPPHPTTAEARWVVTPRGLVDISADRQCL